MRTTISDFVIAFFDLLEAEGREFKTNTEEVIEKAAFYMQRAAFNSSLSVLFAVIIGIIFLIAILSFAFGLFLWFRTFFNPYISAFLLSIGFFIIGFILLLYIKQKNGRD